MLELKSVGSNVQLQMTSFHLICGNNGNIGNQLLKCGFGLMIKLMSAKVHFGIKKTVANKYFASIVSL